MPDELTIITREEAKEKKLPRFFTGIPCVHGHLVERQTSSGTCRICATRNKKKWAKKNPDKVRVYWTKYDYNKPGPRAERAREHRRKNPELANAATRKWRSKNKHVVAAHCSARRALVLKATPSWVDFKDFVAIYAERAKISVETGIEHHVDHIVPLKNKYVCGLHVPWNLQIITAKENQTKNNRFSIDAN